jgi:hypothetical protein
MLTAVKSVGMIMLNRRVPIFLARPAFQHGFQLPDRCVRCNILRLTVMDDDAPLPVVL